MKGLNASHWDYLGVVIVPQLIQSCVHIFVCLICYETSEMIN